MILPPNVNPYNIYFPKLKLTFTEKINLPKNTIPGALWNCLINRPFYTQRKYIFDYHIFPYNVLNFNKNFQIVNGVWLTTTLLNLSVRMNLHDNDLDIVYLLDEQGDCYGKFLFSGECIQLVLVLDNQIVP